MRVAACAQVELKATKVAHVGTTDAAEYPLAKKKQVRHQAACATSGLHLVLRWSRLETRHGTLPGRAAER